MAVIHSNNDNYRKWYPLLVKSNPNNQSGNELRDSIVSQPNTTQSNTSQPDSSNDLSNGRKYPQARSLLDDHPADHLTNELIIHVVIPYGSKSILNPRNYVIRKEGERAFTLFRSHLEFTKFQLKLPADKRFLFETTLGDHIQKPHFDIDINRQENPDIDGNDVIDDLVDVILMILSLDDVEIILERDILVMTSHGEKKWSYHLVINNYFHINNNEARAFYDKVIELMSPDYAKFIDPAVYSKKQQFRIVYNQKPGSGRIKILCEKWEYHGDIIEYKYIDTPRDEHHKMLLQLEASLLTVTNNCIPMPTYIKEEDNQRLSNYSSDVFIPITKDTARSAVTLLAEQGGITPQDPKFPYRLSAISESFVILKRRRPSICRICNRVHEHENPYLLVVGEKKSVYFCCRRNPKKWFLGNLENDASLSASNSEYCSDDNNDKTSPIKSTSPDKSNSIIEVVTPEVPHIPITPNIVDEISRLAQSGDTGRKPLSVNKRISSIEVEITQDEYSTLDKYSTTEPDPNEQFRPSEKDQKRSISGDRSSNKTPGSDAVRGVTFQKN